MRHLRYVLIGVVCVSMSFGIVFAQNDVLEGGTLRGLITDVTPAQNPIEGVEVKIVAQDSGKEFITKTDADGNYKHAGLPAGRYMIRISKEGYDERGGKPVAIVDGGDHFISLKMTLKGDIEPFFKVRPNERTNLVIKQRIVSLIQCVAEGIGKRYNLDAAGVKALHQSILDSIEGASKQGGDLSVFAKPMEEGNRSLLEAILAHPVCKAAFTKHLSEAQLQDYLEFTEAREVRDRQAVAYWLTATLDKELSLRVDQREKVVQSFLNAADNELFPSSMNALWLTPQQAAQLAHHRLKVSLDGTLSETQSKVWQGLVNTNANRFREFVFIPKAKIKHEVEDEEKNEREDGDVNKKRAFLRREPPKHVNIKREVKIVIGDIEMAQPENQPWIEIKADTAESPEQMMEIAEAKLAAHTELLGALDERATRRLALAAKGVAQQYFEAQDETSDLTHHPLYQQAIKDVLSEEAFGAYSKHQTERASLHQQALRDIVVACMDMQMLLDDIQRETTETAASALIPTPLREKSSPTVMFFQLFPQTVDFEVLTPWQQGEFERVFGPIARRR
ncbi:MAG: carboxypeptidase-like regulatory domain-containing protein [Candidatus Poribacteria bacterium]|nr:carboxypeptidase-like regulatory domain-containing protein [Candidatus Poribacteria bacterium]